MRAFIIAIAISAGIAALALILPMPATPFITIPILSGVPLVAVMIGTFLAISAFVVGFSSLMAGDRTDAAASKPLS